MIDNKSIQRALADVGAYRGPLDGLIGPLVREGIKKIIVNRRADASKWGNPRLFIAFQQLMMHLAGIDVGAVDGIWGPQTQIALEKWQNRLRDQAPTGDGPPTKKTTPKWPDQAGVPKFYGVMGANQTLLKPPYQFLLYDSKEKINAISVHVKVADSVERALKKVLSEYGPTTIHSMHLDRYFGSLNVRKMRGGNSWSMHSWGIAIDFDANNNQLRWGRDQALFAKPAYAGWWKAWESEGWVSLGRERNYEYMHVQAARL